MESFENYQNPCPRIATLGEEVDLNIECLLHPSHPNYNTTCKTCIEELTKEIYTCGYTWEASVSNSMCSVKYQIKNTPTYSENTQAFPEKSSVERFLARAVAFQKELSKNETHAKEKGLKSSVVQAYPEKGRSERIQSRAVAEKERLKNQVVQTYAGNGWERILKEHYGIALLIFLSAFGALSCGIVAMIRFRKSRKKSALVKHGQNEAIEYMQLAQTPGEQVGNRREEVRSNLALNQPPPEKNFYQELADFERGVVLKRSWLQIGERIGSGHFSCVYKGDLRMPGKEICSVAIKKSIKGASLSGKY